MGIAGPMGFAWYNEVIEGDNRATLLSFGTTMSTLGGIIGLPVQGKLVDAFGTGATWQIAGLVSMTQVLCYVALGRPYPAPRRQLRIDSRWAGLGLSIILGFCRPRSGTEDDG
ncbi:MAG: hypothetical protein ACREQR_06950 [Candidatus Binataceae bacterium]